MHRERRNLSHIGQKRRRDFDRSARQLYALGLSPWAVEYFRRAARVSGTLPHMIVCQVAMMAAGRMLSAGRALARSAAALEREPANDPSPSNPADASSFAPFGEPSYEAICARRNHIQALWREIQQHEFGSDPSETREGDGSVPDLHDPAPHDRPFPQAPADNGPAHPRSRRRGKAPARHH